MTEDERKALQERIQQSDLSAFSSIGSPLPGTGIYYSPKDRALLTPAQTAYIGSIFAPGAGVADAAGQFPEFPGPDVALEDAFAGDPMPSMRENIAAGGIDRYVIAPLQGLGVLGDATYAAPFVGPVLGPTVGSVLKGVGALSAVPGMIGKAKKTSTGIEALKGTDATKTAIKENLDKFAKDQYGFVSPSLEALLKSAPPNLKGKQITEWLAANANKGVKPKELEYLGIDEFVATNPKATINDVVEGVSDNKVVVGKNVYKGDSYGQANLEFEVTTPEFDPLDSSIRNDEIYREMVTEDLDSYSEDLIDTFNTMRSNLETTKGVPAAKTLDDVQKNADKLFSGGFEDVTNQLAKEFYQTNPYELVKPVQTQGAVGALDDHFAFGNDDVGYQIFIGGQRATDPDNIAYSRAEAKIQLQTKLENDNLLDIVDEGARYKQYVDETLPGGDNYREVVFTWQNAPIEHGVQDHFDELSQISSALIRNRKLADGKQTLHVDELQSDLHTTGSRDGYSTPELDAEDAIQLGKMSSGISTEFTKLKNRILPKLEDAMGDRVTIGSVDINQIKRQIADAEELYARNPQDRYSLVRMNNARRIMFDAINSLNELGVGKGATLEDIAAFTPFDDALKPAFKIASAKEARVPNYPFKDDWYAMSLKQLLMDAIDEGSDAISVSTSAPIKARYTDEYSKFYETLYDQKIPSAMKKLANKYGGKFEKGSLNLEDISKGDIRYPTDNPLVLKETKKMAESNIIRITPEMKQKILEEGFSNFAIGGAVLKPFSIDNIDIFNP
jgi:hypothetical protein